MLELSPGTPAYWITWISLGLFIALINLLLLYVVVRLAITHGMLSYSRKLEESKHLPIYRD